MDSSRPTRSDLSPLSLMDSSDRPDKKGLLCPGLFPVPFLVRLPQEVPHVSSVKIEVPFAAARPRSLIELGSEAILGSFGGEEPTTMMGDLDAGATGTMLSALLPDLIRPVIDRHKPGRRCEVADAYAKKLPLINLENLRCGPGAPLLHSSAIWALCCIRQDLLRTLAVTSSGRTPTSLS